jgi:hypothetical protein
VRSNESGNGSTVKIVSTFRSPRMFSTNGKWARGP